MNNDQVNKPAHYTYGKIEVIDFIEDKVLNFNLGNAVKYISRAGKKNPDKHIEDLEKAAWYLNREIQILKKKNKYHLPLYIAKDQRDDSIRLVKWDDTKEYIPLSQCGERRQEDIKNNTDKYKLSGNDNSESLDYYKLVE